MTVGAVGAILRRRRRWRWRRRLVALGGDLLNGLAGCEGRRAWGSHLAVGVQGDEM